MRTSPLTPAIWSMALLTLTATTAASDDTSSSSDAGTLHSVAEAIEKDDAHARILLAGDLRIFSERLTAAACNVVSGVAPMQSWPTLLATANKFDASLLALRDGAPALGIAQPEPDQSTRAKLGHLSEQWEPVASQARLIGAGAGDANAVRALAAATGALSEVIDELVVQLQATYEIPSDILGADAEAIGIAMRQALLSEEIAKQTCLIGTGLADERSVAQLTTTAKTYDASLHALYHGMPSTGIASPPSEDISQALAGMITSWEDLQPSLARASANGTSDRLLLSTVYEDTNALTDKMQMIVGLYSEAASSER